MKHFEGLIEDRKIFLEQLYNLVKNQFKAQERLTGKTEEIIEILDNDPDYIQRIFIDAPWGMGKSYFAKAFEEKVTLLKDIDGLEVIKINAWETDYYSEPMKSLIGEMNSSGKIDHEILEKGKKLVTNTTKVAIEKILKNLVFKKLNLSDSDISEIKSIFSGMNENALKEYKEYKKLIKEFKKYLSEDNKKKIILIDELDRCKPSYAIEFLETIKHIFGVKNLIFIFLVNKEQLGGVISTMYLPNDKSNEYFEKFFDLELKLPEMNYQELVDKEYKESLNFNIKDEELQRDNFINYTFIEIFKSNYLEKNVSVRKFLKIFKKFKLLISTLSDEEKSYYFLVIYLGIVFFRKECPPKEHPEVESIEKIFDITFFINEEVKEKYSRFETLFKNYKRIISLKTGEIDHQKRRNNFTIKVVKSLEANRAILNFNSINIKKIYVNIDSYTVSFPVFVELPKSIFSEDDLRNNLIKVDNRYLFNDYDINLITQWAEKKCNFLNRME